MGYVEVDNGESRFNLYSGWVTLSLVRALRGELDDQNYQLLVAGDGEIIGPNWIRETAGMTPTISGAHESTFQLPLNVKVSLGVNIKLIHRVSLRRVNRNIR